MGSRVECGCGNIVYTGSFPNEYVYSVVSEEAYDEVLDPFDRTKASRLFFGQRKLLECNICGSIMLISRDGKVTHYKKNKQDAHD